MQTDTNKKRKFLYSHVRDGSVLVDGLPRLLVRQHLVDNCRYTGVYLRVLRSERGVGRPPKVLTCAEQIGDGEITHFTRRYTFDDE